MHAVRPQRKARLLSWMVAGLLATALGCGGPRLPPVEIPPRLDLTGFERIGIIDVQIGGARRVGVEATERFMHAIHASQTGVPLLELGSEHEVLARVGHDRLDFEAVQAIGARYGVDAILVGQLELSEARPKVKLSAGLQSLSARAEIHGSFHARLLGAQGATLWSASAEGRRDLAELRARKGSPLDLRTGDPDAAYERLVRGLIQDATRDLRPTWQRR